MISTREAAQRGIDPDGGWVCGEHDSRSCRRWCGQHGQPDHCGFDGRRGISARADHTAAVARSMPADGNEALWLIWARSESP